MHTIDREVSEKLLEEISKSKRIQNKFSGIPKDERQSCIHDGYILAINTFDESKNVPFEVFLYQHIEWQCLKWLKKEKSHNKLKYKVKGLLLYDNTQVYQHPGLNFSEMLDGVDEESKELLRLRFVEDKTLTEIGKIYDCSHETIRLKLNKIIEGLREQYT